MFANLPAAAPRIRTRANVFERLAVLSIAFLVMTLLAGCSEDRRWTLDKWTLLQQDQPETTVLLPCDPKVLRSSSTEALTLVTDVTWPPPAAHGETDGYATFVLPTLAAPREVHIDDQKVEPLDLTSSSFTPRIRPHRYPIPPAALSKGHFVVSVTWPPQGRNPLRIDAAPFLSPTPHGGPSLLLSHNINQMSCIGALAGLALAILVSGAIALGCQDSLYGLYALMALSASYFPAYLLGVTSFVFGTKDDVVLAITFCITMWTILAVYLRKTEQRWPSSAWNGAYLIVGGMQLIALHPRAPTHFGLFTWGPLLAATFGQMVLLGGRRLFRGSLSVPQRVSLIVWPVTNILCMPDLAFAAGCSGGLDATAFHPAMAGFSFCIVAEAMAELAEWYALLNTMHSDLLVQRTALREQGHALVSLSDELRTQVHGRASSLATALARLAKNQSRKGATELPFDQRYTFGEVLGEGGMGCVYAAKRHSDGREVAIKLLRNTKDFTLVSRFAREAEIATSLAHPHVVAVHDFGIAENGVPYLVMERIFGPSLRDMAEYHGNVTWSLPVLNGIAEGLAALHARGILHRDLKPANILLEFRVDSPRPHPKLTDFGLSSKHLAPKGHPDESSVTLTRPGETVGTPTYMSPEAMFDPTLVTQATDIFSFGLIAVELLTGLPPPVNPPLGFALASDPHATLPPLRVLCPELPASTAAVLLDCLQRDPSLRPTAAMLAQALATKSLSNDRNPSLGDALRARLSRKTRLS